jgi:signal transduction histidine kinase/ActR/RegA family two-component response regulator
VSRLRSTLSSVASLPESISPRPLDLPAWRLRILDQVLTWTAVAGAVPCAAGIWLSIEGGIWPLALLDLVSWGAVVTAAAAPRLPYQLRAMVALAVYGSVGLGVLVATGPYGVGLLWLMAVPALAGVLVRPRMVWLAQALVLAALTGVGVLAETGVLVWPGPPVTATWWLMAWTSLLCVSMLAGVSTAIMMRGLQQSLLALQAEVEARRRAEEDREALVRQLVLAQKMEAVGQLASGFAHDLNNVLTVIRLEANLAHMSVEPESEAAESLDHILQGTDSAAALCGKLLLFARQRPSARAPMEVDAQLLKFEPLLARLVGERVQLRFDLGAGSTRVMAEPIELEQVLVNLMANARDAMPTGGRIFLSTRPVVTDGGLQVRLEVRDEGVGMDEVTLGRIFEPFFTTKAEGAGTGLGLPTVYAITKSLKGVLEVDSKPGMGASFRLLLPATEDSAAPALPALPSMRLSKELVRVLVVEDQDGVRSVVERVLTQLGCEVSAVSSVQAALDWLAKQTVLPELVLTDIVMPGATGVDLAEQVLRRYPSVRLLGMSGWLTDGDLAVRLQLLGVPLLRKPFTPAELAAAVAERMAKRAG